MDLVIPLGNGSKWDNKELKYALRSIDIYMPYVGDVFILGERQAWLKDVNYISASDREGLEHKERNIMQKILLACQYPLLSNDFIFFNDDHFLLHPIKSLPYYANGTLQEYSIKRTKKDAYLTSVHNTIDALEQQDKPTFMYDIHCPIVYNKYKFQLVMEMYDWTLPYGYVIKSLYCNTLGIKPTHYHDLKIKTRANCNDLDRLCSGRRFFSISDEAVGLELETYLNYIYPNKSKYEI